MQAIVAADRSWGIGYGNSMLYQLPADLKYFSAMTRGKALVMGRLTLLSLPGGKPLKDRVNIIVSRDAGFKAEGAVLVHSLAQLKKAIAAYPPDDVMLIGGQQIYDLLIDSCNRAYVTKIDAVRQADCFFPNLDIRPNWKLIDQSPVLLNNGLSYTHCTYQNNQAAPIT